MEEVADVDEHRADHDRLPNEHDQWADLSVFEDLRAKRKCDVRDDGNRNSADLPRGQAAAPVPPYGCDDHAGGAALKQGLEHRQRRQVVNPVARRQTAPRRASMAFTQRMACVD